MRDALDEGLLLLNGGHNVNSICLTPPLVISIEELDYCIKVLDKIIRKYSEL